MIKTVRQRSRKARGAHFTPIELARFLASRLIQHFGTEQHDRIRVLDPACGDGALLAAFAAASLARETGRVELVGVESDEATQLAATENLVEVHANSQTIIHGDFLELWASRRNASTLWEREEFPTALDEPFDFVIANPPYVRTQIIGATKAHELAVAFGLSGRIDLYHPFLIAATESLREGGLLGVITSNRFLCTQSGAAVRSFLSRKFDVLEIIDLGDTKLFEAAVLPAILIGRRVSERATRPRTSPSNFVKIYSQHGDRAASHQLEPRGSLFDVLATPSNGTVQIHDEFFQVSVGQFQLVAGATEPWMMLAQPDSDWLHCIRQESVGVVKDFAAVRVGIKTTADRVFIRSDWNSLPGDQQPEPELLHPILTHEDARRWTANSDGRPRFSVLYPHEVVDGRRRAIDLRGFPNAKRYLESHREQLEGRDYVIEAGRKWYEIWVPQDPDGWSTPKVVCPDISPEPRFYLDRSGLFVDGDSYWITLDRGHDEALLYLILAVANSRLMATFHDLAFNNRLYSGRRRYLTQHVAHYPLPDPLKPASRRLVQFVRSFLAEPTPDAKRIASFEETVDALVAESFNAPIASSKGGSS